MNDDITKVTVHEYYVGWSRAEHIIGIIEEEVNSGQRVEIDLSKVSSMTTKAARMLQTARARFGLVAFTGMSDHVDLAMSMGEEARRATA